MFTSLSSVFGKLADRALALVVPHAEADAAPLCPGCKNFCHRACCPLGGANLWIVESCPKPGGGGCTTFVYGKC